MEIFFYQNNIIGQLVATSMLLPQEYTPHNHHDVMYTFFRIAGHLCGECLHKGDQWETLILSFYHEQTVELWSDTPWRVLYDMSL